ncbi:anhydro-N-acetylmuramic acid kinase [Cladophialophora psammophila CBS 110553]|uniref:Anhydro-N-acetylmuramic acid kinase n=1 Tax=Cladophialophora psammophila CBS 110553 TaxID=1182543 RepID=W9X2R2_9EURO|nr:anhydro-N-acetylmuramic acid kinase [Cladophialophora psammophila CBS 110553]EXJ74468.1 anhydro-N-acetylmuramic acid kinase [Cladophialophora psammophila CBS 110553]
MPYIIGLNSGSSFDGIDAVLCSIDIAPDGHPDRPKYIDGISEPWPEELQPDVLKAFSNELPLFDLCRLNYAAGAAYADITNKLLDKVGMRPEEIDVVGYDGQTIYQEPPNREREREYFASGSKVLVDRWTKGGFACGLFIVESGVVTALTNITTVTQFRPIDHALGGSGAPLMQYLDFCSFRTEGPIVSLNIGGIANLQLADADRHKMMAFDTGPGNVMIDHVMKVREGKPYDAGGALAARGQVIPTLLARLEEHKFFLRKPPRSAWRLDFGGEHADKILDDYKDASSEDILATLTLFTAKAIERSVVDFILPKTPVKTVIASGGGTRNDTLMSHLKERLALHGVALRTSDEYGLPAPFKEAIKFATLAFACMNGLANNIPAAGGASSFAVLGVRVQHDREVFSDGVP